jgi:drug/metabolite transporter (DMT)-like permease
MKSGSKPPVPAWVADLSLAAVTAIWGWSFVLVRDGVAGYPVFPFLAVRFTLAALVMGIALSPRLGRIDRATVWGGVLMGIFLFTGYAFQTWGLLYTSASHSGIITGLFVVFVPLLEAARRRKLPPAVTWAAAAVSTAGLAVLAEPWKNCGGVNLGDLLSVACAVVYAFHILVTAHQARLNDTGSLAAIQVATVAVMAWLFSAPYLGRVWPIPPVSQKAIVLTALLATAVAYFAQTACQKYTTPTRTAFLFTLEPVFAAFFAVLVGGEKASVPMVAGGGLVVAGMLLGEWASVRMEKEPTQPPSSVIT